MVLAPAGRSLSEEEFTKEFDPKVAPGGDLLSYGDVGNMPTRLVWSVVESGDDEDPSWYASPGFHVVNVLGYCVSEKPWTDDIDCATYFYADPDDFEEDETE